MMAGCWGTKSQIEILKSIGDKWLSNDDGSPRTVLDEDGKQKRVEPFCIGNSSGINGGAMRPHSSHRDGTGADLNQSDSNPICNTLAFRSVFDRNQTDELCELLINGGMERIIFNCHYIIKRRERVQEMVSHHHHIHCDGPGLTRGPMRQLRFTSCGGCNIWGEGKCPDEIYKVFHRGEWVEYDNTTTNYAPGDSRGRGAVRLFEGSDLNALTKAEWEEMNDNNTE
ncbi:hypothetical protein QA601_18290 [Chitinispirillales bacterium ANBcel5]|uniref:hypothetical protein n=1 Tax=Cellulosispirillum alkaliphilum TaxID=3039283 RepID=UPI002A4F1A3D|nr:hypothetical protein [Chitinispirillales bacterium ANBcel5]